MSRGLLYFAVALVFTCYVAANENYAYMVFWSDSSCSQFAGMKGLNQEQQALTITAGQNISCSAAMRCINNPSSPECASIATGTTSLSVNYNLYGRLLVTDHTDGTTTYAPTDDNCVQSTIYENCYYNFWNFREFSQTVDAQSPNSAAFLLPNVLVVAVAMMFFF